MQKLLFPVILLCATLLLAFGGLAEAQAVAVDYTKAHLTWTEPAGQAPTGYNVKCGLTTGGPYTLTKSYAIGGAETITAGSILIGDLVTTSGTYFCIVTAFDTIGESANSTEITFQAGRIPAVPTSLAIVP